MKLLYILIGIISQDLKLIGSGLVGPDLDLATSCVSRVTGGEVMIFFSPSLNWVYVRASHPLLSFSFSVSVVCLAGFLKMRTRSLNVLDRAQNRFLSQPGAVAIDSKKVTVC